MLQGFKNYIFLEEEKREAENGDHVCALMCLVCQCRR